MLTTSAHFSKASRKTRNHRVVLYVFASHTVISLLLTFCYIFNRRILQNSHKTLRLAMFRKLI